MDKQNTNTSMTQNIQPKKGKGKLILIIFIVFLGLGVCVCGAGAIGLYLWYQSDNIPEPDNDNLVKVETNGAIMYYPDYYERVAKANYRNPENNSLEGNNNTSIIIEGDFQNTEIDSKESCLKAAKGSTDETSEDFSLYDGIEVDFSEDDVTYNTGLQWRICRFSLDLNVEGDFGGSDKTLMIKVKIISKTSDEPDQHKTIQITYDKDTDPDEIQDLEDSLEAFKVE